MEIILASASPRRRELLTQIGLEFRICVSDAEETVTKKEPADIVMELSEKKAAGVAAQILSGKATDSRGLEILPGELLILGADTLVFLDGEQMGKPSDASDAFSMLSRLQGRVHQVYTGVTFLVLKDGKIVSKKSFYEKTQVEFYPMSKDEIQGYIETKEPVGKAGSYAIQGFGSRYVKRIEGDYNNVVGLPVARVYRELKNIENHRIHLEEDL